MHSAVKASSSSSANSPNHRIPLVSSASTLHNVLGRNDIYRLEGSRMLNIAKLTHSFFLGSRWRASLQGHRLEVGKVGEFPSSTGVVEKLDVRIYKM